jgi:hypothetical protein
MSGSDVLRQAAHVFMGCARAELAWRTSEELADPDLLEHVKTAQQLAYELIAELAFGELGELAR